MADKIVAIGLLTSDELKRLGHGFSRYYPMPEDDVFADIMSQLDEIPPVESSGTWKDDSDR